ncbi:MAG: STAS domain-containing protein [Spirochaetales bacterium]|nr:STAS domain-containing protein [Spirochaetales bacterium]
MDIRIKKEDTIVTVYIDGNIDINGGDMLSEKLNEIMFIKNVTHVIFTMENVNSITSAGIGKLLNFYKYLNGRNASMEIKGVSDVLYEQFIEIHLDRIFPISKS